MTPRASVAATALARLGVLALGRMSPSNALRELLRLEDFLTLQINRVAIRYEGGVHPKHRLTRYHDFFVERVQPGERVLDVGCGKGELAYDLAARASAHVVGIDVNQDYLRVARERFAHPRLELVEADALAYGPSEPFDVVVLSNVLEHVEDRPGLLRRLVERARPRRVLVRVPLLTRDWSVPLRRELGVPYMSDATHHVEYEPEGLVEEMRSAGLTVSELLVNWGEIWAVGEPAVE